MLNVVSGALHVDPECSHAAGRADEGPVHAHHRTATKFPTFPQVTALLRGLNVSWIYRH